MKKILFPIEKLAIVFFYFQLLLQLDKVTYAIFSIILMALSLAIEGARPYTPLLFLVIILEMFNFTIVQVIVIILAGIIGAALKLYDINVPIKGPFLMGHKYKIIQVENNKLMISLFYPTMVKTKKIEWIPKKEYNKVLYQIFHVDPKARRIPYQLFQFIISYIHKIYMPAEEESPYISETDFDKNTDTIQNRHKVIIFSHGLGSHLNAYSSIFANWASQGYTIVSVNHDHDEVCLDYRKASENDIQKIRDYIYPLRHRDLQIRVKQMAKAIQIVQNKNFMKQYLDSDVQVKQIILAGHSYGGATAIATKAHINKAWGQKSDNQKKVSKVIALDPWLFPFTEQIFSNLNNENILIINSHHFYQQVPYFYNLQSRFVKLKERNKDLIAFMIKGMDHVAQCDMAYVFGNILQFTGTIKLQRHTDNFMALNILICQQFLKSKQKQQILSMANKFIEDRQMHLSRISILQEYRTTRQLTFGRPRLESQKQIIDII